MAGCVIQATGVVVFEDGLWIGNHLKAQNSLQRVHTIPRVPSEAGVHTKIPLRGKLNSNILRCAWVPAVKHNP